VPPSTHPNSLGLAVVATAPKHRVSALATCNAGPAVRRRSSVAPRTIPYANSSVKGRREDSTSGGTRERERTWRCEGARTQAREWATNSRRRPHARHDWCTAGYLAWISTPGIRPDV